VCLICEEEIQQQQMEKSKKKKGEEDEASAIDGRKSMSSAGVHIYTNRQFLFKSTPL
jgi:hypothetical protein